MAFICSRICFFCRGDFHPGKMRDPKDGLYSGYCRAHWGDPDFFLDHGVYRRILESDFFRKGKHSGFLILSGAATGASWLCYFKALQLGDINKVVPLDKSSTVLTILLALIFLGEGISWEKAGAVLVIALGIFLMIEKKDSQGEGKRQVWAGFSTGPVLRFLPVLRRSWGRSGSLILSPIWERPSVPVSSWSWPGTLR